MPDDKLPGLKGRPNPNDPDRLNALVLIGLQPLARGGSAISLLNREVR